MNYHRERFRKLSKSFTVVIQPLSTRLIKPNVCLVITVFVSRTSEQKLNVKETKPAIVDQQCVVYGFQCDLCDADYVGYTRGHLRNRVKGHKQQSSAIAKHYKNMHGTMPQNLLKRLKELKKCRNKFDC